MDYFVLLMSLFSYRQKKKSIQAARVEIVSKHLNTTSSRLHVSVLCLWVRRRCCCDDMRAATKTRQVSKTRCRKRTSFIHSNCFSAPLRVKGQTDEYLPVKTKTSAHYTSTPLKTPLYARWSNVTMTTTEVQGENARIHVEIDRHAVDRFQ